MMCYGFAGRDCWEAGEMYKGLLCTISYNYVFIYDRLFFFFLSLKQY